MQHKWIDQYGYDQCVKCGLEVDYSLNGESPLFDCKENACSVNGNHYLIAMPHGAECEHCGMSSITVSE
jgi:hypothetical protein